MPVQRSNKVFDYGTFEEFCAFVETFPENPETHIARYAQWVAHKHALPCQVSGIGLVGDYTITVPGSEPEKHRLPRWAWFVHVYLMRFPHPTLEDMRYACLMCNLCFKQGARNEELPPHVFDDQYFEYTKEQLATPLPEQEEPTPEEILRGVMGLGEEDGKQKATA